MRIPKNWEKYVRSGEYGTRKAQETGVPARPFRYETAMPTQAAIDELAELIGHADAIYILKAAWAQLKIDNRPNPDSIGKSLSKDDALTLQRQLIKQYVADGMDIDKAMDAAANEVSKAKPADTIDWCTKAEAKELDELENAMLLARKLKD